MSNVIPWPARRATVVAEEGMVPGTFEPEETLGDTYPMDLDSAACRRVAAAHSGALLKSSGAVTGPHRANTRWRRFARFVLSAFTPITRIER